MILHAAQLTSSDPSDSVTGTETVSPIPQDKSDDQVAHKKDIGNNLVLIE